MSYSVVPKMRRDGQIKLLDNGGSNTLTIEFESGDFNFSPSKDAEIIIRDRNAISNVRRGDQEASATGSFTVFMREFTDSAQAGSVMDFVNKTGHYNGNVSTGGTGTPRIEEYCIDIEYTAEGTDNGDDADHKATLSKCICNVVFTEGDPSTLAINFTCYGGVSYVGPS
tara:strand:- start:14 stop:520 length:507 start_codon:yes stop_codon:yes gene_type:complete